MLKMEDIRKMDTKDLVKKSTELRDEIAEMRRRNHMGEMQNTRALRVKRRDLARMLTVLSEELAKENA
jgi:ribosomal protein L29